MTIRLLCLTAVAFCTTNPVDADESEAAAKWMTYLTGTWAYESPRDGATGQFTVRKSAIDNVLLVRGMNAENRLHIVSIYVWDGEKQTLHLSGGFKMDAHEGAFSVTFDEFADDKISGKDGDGQTVGYAKVDENEWHVVDGDGDATVKLKRQASAEK